MKHFTLITFCLFTLTINAQLTNISPSDLEEGDLFGFVADIDGDDLILSASSSNELQEDFGALYHYIFDGTSWQLNQKILPTLSEIGNSSRMGKWISISGDWIAASIDGDDQITHVAFYKRENDVWVRHSKISNYTPEARFGWQIDLDGDQVIIGAINDFDQMGVRSGAAYIYEYNAVEDKWQPTAWFVPISLELGDLFGAAVYIKDGLAAVASRNDNDNGDDSGAVYIFEKNLGVWSQTAKLKPDDGMPDDKFGYRIDGDDNKLIISGYGSDNQTGAAYIFSHDTDWVQEARLNSVNVSEGDWFGSSIALEGDRAIIGARYHTGEAFRSGALFVFENEEANWVEKSKFIDPDGQFEHFLGGSLVYENEKLIVTSYGYEDKSGAAFTLNIDDLVSTQALPDQKFTIYPNPSAGHLNLDIGKMEVEEIEIYSIEGVLQRSFKYDGSAIDISQLNAGYYLLKRKVDALPIGKFMKI